MSNLTLLAPALEEARVRLRAVITQTTSATLAVADSGKAITNSGATSSITYTLPSAVAGRWYEIRNATDAYTLTVSPNGSDRIGTRPAGDVFVLPARGVVVLECHSASRWEITTEYSTAFDGPVDVTKYGVVGNGTVDDGPTLNSLITAVAAAGGGEVLIPRGRSVRTTQTIVVPATIHLRMDRTAEIKVDADVHGVELRGCVVGGAGGGSCLSGGRIIVNHSGYTKACIFLDGDRTGGTRFHRQGAVRIRDVILQGKAGQNAGIGIYMKAHATNSVASAVQWVTFDGVNIIDFNDGVWMDCYEANANFVGFINGNTFSNIFMQNCVNFWHMTCSGAGGGANGDMSLNNMISTVYQVSTATQKLIKVDGNSSSFCSKNYFIAPSCFDWDSAPAASPIAVDLALGTGWVFTSAGGLKPHQFSMLGSNYILGETLRTHVGSALPTEADKWKNSMRQWVGNTGGNRAGLILSDGVNWRTVVGTGGDRINYTGRQITLSPLDCISRQLHAQNTPETGVPTVVGLVRASVGSEVHIQRRAAGSNEHVYIFCPNTAFTQRVYDPFAGTDSGAGNLLRLDSQFAEVIVRVLENFNTAILFKRGTISFQSMPQAQEGLNAFSVPASGSVEQDVTVTGADTAKPQAYAFYNQDTGPVTLSAVVHSANIVRVTFTNPTSTAVSIPSGVLYALARP
jgi:hypothetical protein